jgi:hypothetical protein
MSQTNIITESVIGPYTAVPVGAGDLNITWTAADPVNGNQIIYDTPYGDLLLAWNTAYSTSATFTLSSTQDAPFLRTGDISNYTLAAGQILAFYLGNFPSDVPTGWSTLIGGSYYIDFRASTSAVKFAILQLQGSEE